MTPSKVTVRVPATTANLGPAFDCLALALDLWNTCTFNLTTGGVRVEVAGEGAGKLPLNTHNLTARAFFEVYRRQGQGLPPGVEICCDNQIPLGSGLGSSAAAVLSGIAAANLLLGTPLRKLDMLTIAHEMEGHADNAAAALQGGLALVTTDSQGSQKIQDLPYHPWNLVVVLPDFKLPTAQARQALPEFVPLRDAVHNIGHALLTAEALRVGSLETLLLSMEDRLHQPYRFRLVPGAEAAVKAAQVLGAPAGLSGAGPSIIAFAAGNEERIQAGMMEAFRAAGLTSRAWKLTISPAGLSAHLF